MDDLITWLRAQLDDARPAVRRTGRMARGVGHVIRCWQCGAEPALVETTCLGDTQPSYVPGRWPPGDHEHEVAPPSPGELLARGDRAAARILAIAAE